MHLNVLGQGFRFGIPATLLNFLESFWLRQSHEPPQSAVVALPEKLRVPAEAYGNSDNVLLTGMAIAVLSLVERHRRIQ